jgi:hypothetical protein
MSHTLTLSAPDAAVLRNRELARELVAACFDPPRPDEFARFCIDERGRFVFASFAAAFPDARLYVEWTVAAPDRVVIGGRMAATHSGAWRGIAASGKHVGVATVASLGIAAGRVVDVSIVSDSLSIAEQIGAVAPFAPPACRHFGPAGTADTAGRG